MFKRVSIWDMDGTIVCSLHRYRTMHNGQKEVIDLQHWRDNSHKAYEDKLLPLAKVFQKDLNDPECYTIIATARVLDIVDMAFIHDKLGVPNRIISRQHDDSISGGLLKIRGLRGILNLRQFKNLPCIFYEDNEAYLKAVCQAFPHILGKHCPSLQGH